ncbi:MAG: glycosyltransferase [Acidobacteria bacterium]|nr:glycosyltransferase [Acidobacteriota bacterium]
MPSAAVSRPIVAGPRHIVAVALGSFGDVHPILGVARALQDRGHAVDFIANPLYEELVRSNGLAFHAIGAEQDFLDVIENPKMWLPRHGVRILGESLILPYMRPTFELIERLRRPETILIAPVTAFGARIANEVFDLPLATLDLQPVLFRSELDSPGLPLEPLSRWAPLGRLLRRAIYWTADMLFFDPVLQRPTNAFRAEFGLEAIRRPFHDWVHSPDRTIGLFPPWYGEPQPDWPETARATGFPRFDEADQRPLPEGLEEFLAGGDAPIVFTPGTAMSQARRFFEASVEVCRLLGRRGILLSHFPEQIPQPLPETMRYFEYVPLSRVLPRAAALVYHGGIGTASQALAAGIPHLVAPYSFDQPDNAARLHRLGVGRTLFPIFYSPRRAAERLRWLLETPSVQAACRRWREAIAAQDALGQTCELIEAL